MEAGKARHAGREQEEVPSEDDDPAPSHVLAAVVPHSFYDGSGARVPDMVNMSRMSSPEDQYLTQNLSAPTPLTRTVPDVAPYRQTFPTITFSSDLNPLAMFLGGQMTRLPPERHLPTCRKQE